MKRSREDEDEEHTLILIDGACYLWIEESTEEYECHDCGRTIPPQSNVFSPLNKTKEMKESAVICEDCIQKRAQPSTPSDKKRMFDKTESANL